MGRVAESLAGEVVTKTTGGLLAIPRDAALLPRKGGDLRREANLARAVCCQCSLCTQMCPRNAMGLHVQPHKVMRALAYGDCSLAERDANGVFSCCDCGLCTYYACNFGLHPSHAMQAYKQRLRDQGRAPVKEVREAPSGFQSKRLPTERLLSRLALKRYDVDAPYGGEIDPDEVCIPLKMHVGGPCRPVVSQGDTVSEGQLIAEPEGLGARIHASIPGRVVEVTARDIRIRK